MARADAPAELVLGTAQFGDAYGATNRMGRLSDEQVAAILAAADGVTVFDTSAEYGDSQQRLGRFAERDARYVTKFALPADGPVTADALFGSSLATLGVDRLDGVLFHRLADLDDPRAEAAVAVLRTARDEGTVRSVGVSVYDLGDIRAALRVFPDLNLLQMPGNVVDRRLLDDPLVGELHHAGVRIHVRSAFLQGVLLTPPDRLPARFAPLRPAVARVHEAAAHSGQTVVGLLLRFLRDHPRVDGVVVGAAAPEEMREIVAEWRRERVGPDPVLPDTAPMLDPRAWPPVDA